MAYIQRGVRASSGNWWCPWTVWKWLVCLESWAPLGSFPSARPGPPYSWQEHLMSRLFMSFLKGDSASTIQRLPLTSCEGLASHRCAVPHVAAAPRGGLSGGCRVLWLWDSAAQGVASGMHSFCHNPCSPALGDSGWHVPISSGNENHILCRLQN